MSVEHDIRHHQQLIGMKEEWLKKATVEFFAADRRCNELQESLKTHRKIIARLQAGETA